MRRDKDRLGAEKNKTKQLHEGQNNQRFGTPIYLGVGVSPETIAVSRDYEGTSHTLNYIHTCYEARAKHSDAKSWVARPKHRASTLKTASST